MGLVKIENKATKKVYIVRDEEWDGMVKNGKQKYFTLIGPLPEVKLRQPIKPAPDPILPPKAVREKKKPGASDARSTAKPEDNA